MQRRLKPEFDCSWVEEEEEVLVGFRLTTDITVVVDVRNTFVK